MMKTANADELVSTVGGPSRRFTADKGLLSTLFDWFADERRLCVVSTRVERDLERYDVGFCHALGHVGDRDLWIVVPRLAAEAIADRLPFLDVPIRVYGWDSDGVRIQPVPRPSEVFDRYRGTLRGGPHRLGPLEALIGPLLAWLEAQHELAPVNRQSYLTWHFHGRQVLELRASFRTNTISVRAGTNYSSPGPGRPAPLELAITQPLTSTQLTEVIGRVEAAVEARRSGEDIANAEHELQDLLSDRFSALGLIAKPDREVPAVRPVKNGYVDLLGADHRNRLHVIETKIGPDEGLIIQGLDYWIWTTANIKALGKQRGIDLDDTDQADLDFVIAEKSPGRGLIGSYTSAQAEALAGSIRWRFTTVRDWRDGAPIIDRLAPRVLPAGSRGRGAPRKTPPRWSARLGDQIRAQAGRDGVIFEHSVFWPELTQSLVPAAMTAHEALNVAGLVHPMIRHIRSSQAFALNLFAPLDDAARVAVAQLVGVDAIAVDPPLFEWFDPQDRLHERTKASPHATQVDVLLRAHDDRGRRHATLIEVKLTEADFNYCSAWASERNDRRDVCATDGPFGTEPAACFQLRNHDRERRRLYDAALGRETNDLTNVVLPVGYGCWFRYGANQPMRNAALARVLVDAGEVDSATVVLCAPASHTTIWNRWHEAKELLSDVAVAFAELPAEALIALHPEGVHLRSRYSLNPTRVNESETGYERTAAPARVNERRDGTMLGPTSPLRHCDRERALRAIDQLRDAHSTAPSIASSLEAAVRDRSVSDDVLIQHSRWCNTGGSYSNGVPPAREAALAMYGFVPDRLKAEDGALSPEMESLLSEYKRRLTG
jgi:hypothetical protein